MDNTKNFNAHASKQIASFPHWYHKIKIAPGIVTPGTHDSSQELTLLDKLGLPSDCKGMRVLDIGCCDGFFSFELERRGADVLAIDFTAPGIRGFSIAAELLQSKVKHQVANVYDLKPAEFGKFDLVLFLGVLYHLRNPMLALDKVRSVSEFGGALFVETQLATDPQVLKSKSPLCQFFPSDSLYGDGTNKWGPNQAGLIEMIKESQFEIVDENSYGHRGYAYAKAISDEKLESFRKIDSSTSAFGPNQKNKE